MSIKILTPNNRIIIKESFALKRGRSPPKDSMKLLFNPYKNVGVYAENVWKTIFPIANEKRGRIFKCVLL